MEKKIWPSDGEELIEKVEIEFNVYSGRWAPKCVLHVSTPLTLYRLSVFPLPRPNLAELERVLFILLWGYRAHMVRCETFHLYPSKSGKRTPNMLSIVISYGYNIMITADSWRKMPRKPAWLCEICTLMIGKTIVYPKVSIPSIANFDMLKRSSLGWKQTSLKSSSCLESYIEYYTEWGNLCSFWRMKSIVSHCLMHLGWNVAIMIWHL